MKICIVSDSHDNRPLLTAAVADAVERGAEAILHCGDVVAAMTLKGLQRFDIPVHVIHGNNTGDLYTLGKLACTPGSNINYYGQDAGIELAGRHIFLVHYPHYARAMATTGDWDMVCCGHDHRCNIEHLPNIKGRHSLLVNPGTVAGIGAPPTYAFGDLATMEFHIIDVPTEAQTPKTPAAATED